MKLIDALDGIGPYQAINFDPDHMVTSVWNIEEARHWQISFATRPVETWAGVVVTDKPENVTFNYEQPSRSNPDKVKFPGTLIVHPRPRWAISKIAEKFTKPLRLKEPPPFCHDVTILEVVSWGENLKVGPGSRLGTVGFGFERDDDGYFIMPHLGGVVIGDDVDIQANVCVDRGTFSNTVIGTGTKIDNHVHVAHNCKIGRDVMITAGVILGGSVTVEDRAWLGLNSTIMQGVTIGVGATIGIGAVVLKDVEPGQTIVGAHRIIESKGTQRGVIR